MMTTLPLPAR